MRLLNTQTHIFQEFFEDKVPRYSILSHRWEEDEVSYSEFLAGEKRSGKGYQKIMQFCELSLYTGYLYAWIDTCCIDKRSSAELSEAVNAMCRWYGHAGVCYVYLSDVKQDAEFEYSQWFTRGWTLQELLAPRELKFLDCNWKFLFTRHDAADRIATISGVAIRALTDESNWRLQPRMDYIRSCTSIAQRMSWASTRFTSRPEDMFLTRVSDIGDWWQAYCLLGLFDVNMPLLYGEGDYAAFQRLQKEILSGSHDETIFAWTPPSSRHDAPAMLAPVPGYFQGCGSIVALDEKDHGFSAISRRKPYVVTNRGLYMQIHPIKKYDQERDDIYTFPINCKSRRKRAHRDTLGEPSYPMVISLERDLSSRSYERYCRIQGACQSPEVMGAVVISQLKALDGHSSKDKVYLRLGQPLPMNQDSRDDTVQAMARLQEQVDSAHAAIQKVAALTNSKYPPGLDEPSSIM